MDRESLECVQNVVDQKRLRSHIRHEEEWLDYKNTGKGDEPNMNEKPFLPSESYLSHSTIEQRYLNKEKTLFPTQTYLSMQQLETCPKVKYDASLDILPYVCLIDLYGERIVGSGQRKGV